MASVRIRGTASAGAHDHPDEVGEVFGLGGVSYITFYSYPTLAHSTYSITCLFLKYRFERYIQTNRLTVAVILPHIHRTVEKAPVAMPERLLLLQLRANGIFIRVLVFARRC